MDVQTSRARKIARNYLIDDRMPAARSTSGFGVE